MNCYRYKLSGATYDVFATSQDKAKHFLQSVVGYGTPTFIAKVTDFIDNVEGIVVVNVPRSYLTPKQVIIKLIKEEYNRGDIDYKTMLQHMAIVKGY